MNDSADPSSCAAGLENSGHLEEALQLWTRALMSGHDTYAVRLGRGRTLSRMDRHGEAREELAVALTHQADGADAHYYMARACLHLGDKEAARLHYSKAVSLDPVLASPLLQQQLMPEAVPAPSPQLTEEIHRPPADRPAVVASPYHQAPRKEGLKAIYGQSELVRQLREELVQPFRTSTRKGLQGALLIGPPDCGKKFLCRCIAGELKAEYVDLETRDLQNREQREATRTALDDFLKRLPTERPVVVSIAAVEFLHPLPGTAARSQRLPRLFDFLAPLAKGTHKVLLLLLSDVPWLIVPELKKTQLTRTVVHVPPPDRDARHRLLQDSLGVTLPRKLEKPLLDATEGFNATDILEAAVLMGQDVGPELRQLVPEREEVLRFVGEEDRMPASAANLDLNRLVDGMLKSIGRVLPTAKEWYLEAWSNHLDRRYPAVADAIIQEAGPLPARRPPKRKWLPGSQDGY